MTIEKSMAKANFKPFISPQDSLFKALEKMNELSCKLLIIADEKNKYINLITIGDVQRAILKHNDLNTKIDIIKIDEKIIGKPSESEEKLKKQMISSRLEFMPVVNEQKEIVNIITWDMVVPSKQKEENQLDIPTVVMAGGKGTRLKPITNIIPKPLLPLGDETIIEKIFQKFTTASNDFFISLNHKGDEIKNYLNKNIDKATYNISYIQEEKPLGTAGALKFLEGKVNKSFFVTNCDILLEQDLRDVYDYHVQNENVLTVVAAIIGEKLSYGTIDTEENGILSSINEKPEISYKINTGVYLVEPSALKSIPKNSFFNITDLIECLIQKNNRVGVFPINSGSWIDIGEWRGYMKTIRKTNPNIDFN